MSINFPSADFAPTLSGYTGQGAFRFWCQKVLPIVYDDSLSYYELLGKVVVYLNNVIKDFGTMVDNLNEVVETFNKLQDWVNNYLDLDSAVAEQLDKMAENGELERVFGDLIRAEIDQWLDLHPEATTTVQDGSLTLPKFTDELRWKTLNDYVLVEEFGGVGDGITDDSLAFEAALASGKSVHLLDKEYLITAVNLTNNTVIIGNKNSRIKFANTDCRVSGVNLSGIWLSRLRFEFAEGGSPDTLWGQLVLEDCRDVNINNCYIDNGGFRNIIMYRCKNVLIAENTFERLNGNGITFDAVSDAVVFGNICVDCPDDVFHLFDCYAKSGDANNILYANNIFTNYRGNGIQFTGATDGSYTVNGGKVSNCKFRNFGSGAVKIDGVSSLVLIDNCEFEYGGHSAENESYNSLAGYGVVCGGGSGEARNVKISNCLFNSVNYALTHTTLSSNVGFYEISGNRFSGNTRPIRLSYCQYETVIIRDNIFANLEETYITRALPSGVTQDPGSIKNIIIENNLLVGCQNVNILLLGCLSTLFTDNNFKTIISYSPVGVRLTGSTNLTITKNFSAEGGLFLTYIGNVGTLVYGWNYSNGEMLRPYGVGANSVANIIDVNRVAKVVSGQTAGAATTTIPINGIFTSLNFGLLSICRGPTMGVYLVNLSGVVSIAEIAALSISVSSGNLIINSTNALDYSYSLIPLI